MSPPQVRFFFSPKAGADLQKWPFQTIPSPRRFEGYDLPNESVLYTDPISKEQLELHIVVWRQGDAPDLTWDSKTGWRTE